MSVKKNESEGCRGFIEKQAKAREISTAWKKSIFKFFNIEKLKHVFDKPLCHTSGPLCRTIGPLCHTIGPLCRIVFQWISKKTILTSRKSSNYCQLSANPRQIIYSENYDLWFVF